MFCIKLLFIILPLSAIHENSAEVINEQYGQNLHENLSTTPYVSNESQETITLMTKPSLYATSLDSRNNFSSVPLRYVPKHISYGSYTVIPTTPLPKHDAEDYVTDPSAEKLYSVKVSGAPLRFVSTLPTTIKGEKVELSNNGSPVLLEKVSGAPLRFVSTVSTPLRIEQHDSSNIYSPEPLEKVSGAPLRFVSTAPTPIKRVELDSSNNYSPVLLEKVSGAPLRFVSTVSTPIKTEQLDSSSNYSPVPLEKVSGAPLRFVSTAPTPIKRVELDSSNNYSPVTLEKVSGAPLRFVSTLPTPINIEHSPRDLFIKVNPTTQHVNFVSQYNADKNEEKRLYGSSKGQMDVHKPNASSAPWRYVAQSYESPRVTTYSPDFEVREFITNPSVVETLKNVSKIQITSSTPVDANKMGTVKKSTEPIVNEKVVKVTPKPKYNNALSLQRLDAEAKLNDNTKQSKPVDFKKSFIEHVTWAPITTTPQSHLSYTVKPTTGTVVPTTGTVVQATGVPLTTASIMVQPYTSVNHYPLNYTIQEMRIDFTCNGIDTFYGIERNCDQFIECKDNVAKLYRCPPGLHFNWRTVWPAEPCEDKYIVGCDKSLVPPKPSLVIIALQLSGYNCAAGDGYYSHESNCDQFIECKDNVATLYGCPRGWNFNNATKYGENPCAIPSEVPCHKPKPKFSATLVSRRVVDVICPSSNGYIKIYNECEQFIKCERSIASSYKCFAGLQFNQNALWGSDPCSSASEIRCGVVIPPAPKFSATLVTRLEDYICASTNGYFKLDNECELFIKCEHSIASTYKCLNGLQFNRNAAWEEDPCESASIVRCLSKFISPESKFSAKLIGRADGYTCPAHQGYYRDGNNCGQFIKCERGIPFSYQCFPGLQFNHNTALGEDPCASESIVGCSVYFLPPEPKLSAILIGRMKSYVCPSSNGYFRLENDCEQFIKCERSMASKYKCSAGLQFKHDAVWGEDPCASELIVRCRVHILPPPPQFSAILIGRMESYVCPATSGYFGLENDCEQFIKCEKSMASKYKCSSGLQFKHDAEWGEDPCASELIVRCRVQIVPPEPKFSAVLIGTLKSFVCPSSSGYFRLENDCEQFIKCERSMASKYKCSSGLQFKHDAVWGEDPCASELIVRCRVHVLPPPPQFSAILISRMESYVCPASSGYFRLENDCEQFIKCERSMASKYKCSSGLQFKHDAIWGEDPCASELIVRCRVHILPPPPQFSAILIARMESYVCPSSSGYFRLENDCEQFIKCERSVASKYKCSSGLQFKHDAVWGEDPCASELIVRCRVHILPPPPKFSAILIGRMESYMCPSSSGYFRLENDCEQFIKCERSIASKYKCSSGLQFKHDAVWGEDPCASELIVRCRVQILPPPPQFSAILIGRVESYVCPASSGYFRLENDCEQFIKCERSMASKYKCSSGLQFKHDAVWGEDPCASELIVRCRVHILPPPPQFSAILIGRMESYVCPASSGYFRLENDCEQFIKCERSVASKYKCSSGLQFKHDAVWGEDPCASELIVRCRVHILPPPPKFSAILIGRMESYMCPSSSGYFRLENDCEQFIKCERSIASKYKCSSGLQFKHDAVWGEDPCASELIVRCRVQILPPPPQFSAILIGRVESYVCPASSGYFRLENDCEQFIKCERSMASKYKCSSGLQFKHDAVWGEDPCASELIVRCRVQILPPPPQFSAILIGRMESYVCPASSGYFRLENDCEQFIKCERSMASKYKCSSGLQFKHDAVWGEDPCASELIVRCRVHILPPPPKFSAILIARMESYMCPSSSGYFKLENDCEQFIKCERSIASKYKCSSGLQFKHDAVWGEDPCASELIVRCRVQILPPPPQFSAILIGRMESYVCPASSGYFRLENDCEQFIKCERSMASKYKCSSGLQFKHDAVWGEDPCASELIVRCRVQILPPPPQFSAYLIGRMESYVCTSSSGYFRLENDCGQFIKCESSLASLYKCFTGLQFNHNARWGEDPCALPSIAHCETEFVTPAILITSHIDYYMCDTPNGYFRKENECEQFIECKANVPSLYKCPVGLQFDSKARWGTNPCARTSVVRCQVAILSYTLVIEHMTGYICPTSTGYFAAKDECEQFIKCQNNIPSLYKCNNGLHFNRHSPREADLCVTKSVARCEQYKPKTPKPIDIDVLCPHANGNFPLDNLECSKYVVCKDGIGTIMSCPKGLVFNGTVQACDWPINEPSCDPGVFKDFTCPAARLDKSETNEEVLTTFRYYESCTKFIACKGGYPRLLSCDVGRYYDEATGHCVSSELVHDCKDHI